MLRQTQFEDQVNKYLSFVVLFKLYKIKLIGLIFDTSSTDFYTPYSFEPIKQRVE
jgi:hypothetical protein